MSFDRRSSPLSREPEEKQERAVEPHYVLVGQTPDPIAEFCARHGRDLVDPDARKFAVVSAGIQTRDRSRRGCTTSSRP